MGIQTAVLSIAAVMVYSVIGFYFLDKKHFNIDFNLEESIEYALQNYFLIGSSDLIPLDKFASKFILSINVSGFLSWLSSLYPYSSLLYEEYVYKRGTGATTFC